MYWFLSIFTVVVAIYFMVFVILHVIHVSLFGKRFTPNPYIVNYNEEEFNCDRKDASFKIGKSTLRGCYITPRKEYDHSKIIVFCHGMGSSKESYMQDICTIANGGFEVFCFDYLGVNDSDGKSTGGFASGLKCVDYAIKYVHNEFPDKEICVCGHSWGAFNSLNSVRYNKFVKRFCAIAPFISINKVTQSTSPLCYRPLLINTQILETIKYRKYAWANSIGTLKKYDGKALIIHSKDDNSVKFDDSTRIMEEKFRDNERYKFIIMDGKKHNPQYTYEAVKKLYDYYAKAKKLKGEELISYMKSLNWHELGEMDMDIMNQIIEFFK